MSQNNTIFCKVDYIRKNGDYVKISNIPDKDCYLMELKLKGDGFGTDDVYILTCLQRNKSYGEPGRMYYPKPTLVYRDDKKMFGFYYYLLSERHCGKFSIIFAEGDKLYSIPVSYILEDVDRVLDDEDSPGKRIFVPAENYDIHCLSYDVTADMAV